LNGDKEAIGKLLDRAADAIAGNPNGGAMIWATGIFMVLVIVLLLLYWTQSIVVSGTRGKYYTKEFMQQFTGQIGEIDPPVGGAPDDGNGLFSDKLAYKDWLAMNVTQRIHKNFYETLLMIVSVAGIGMLSFPWVTIFTLPVYILGRALFAPVLGCRAPPAVICIVMLICIIFPFWAIFGGSVGFVLQPVKVIDVYEKSDDPIKVARMFPFASSDFVNTPPPK